MTTSCPEPYPMYSVYPSGLERTTPSVPTTPPPPGLLTMTSGCGEYFVQNFSMARAIRSLDPPAAMGTTAVTGFDG